MSPDILDLLLLGGAVCYAVYGLSAGIIRQLGSVAGLAVGYLASRFCSEPVSQSLGLSPLICSIGIFVLCYVGVNVIAKVLRKTARMVLLGPIDRILGALFGVLNWLVITSLLLNLFMFCKPDAEALTGRVAQFTLNVLPRALDIAQQYTSA